MRDQKNPEARGTRFCRDTAIPTRVEQPPSRSDPALRLHHPARRDRPASCPTFQQPAAAMQAWPVKQRITILRDDSEKQASGLHPARSSPKAAPALQPRPASPSKRAQPLVARVVDIDVEAHQADLLKADQLQHADAQQPLAAEPAS